MKKKYTAFTVILIILLWTITEVEAAFPPVARAEWRSNFVKKEIAEDVEIVDEATPTDDVVDFTGDEEIIDDQDSVVTDTTSSDETPEEHVIEEQLPSDEVVDEETSIPDEPDTSAYEGGGNDEGDGGNGEGGGSIFVIVSESQSISDDYPSISSTPDEAVKDTDNEVIIDDIDDVDAPVTDTTSYDE